MGASGTLTTRFGRYDLLRRVSLGGMAEIYKAKAYGDHGFEKIVALKRLLPHVEERPELVRMFVTEAALVAQLSHPRIARIYEVGAVEGVHYIAMQYIYGRDLQAVFRAQKKRGRRASAELVAAVGVMAADALAYAHAFIDAAGLALEIVHRDVSPQNLMLSDGGALTLIDFGIAKFVGRGDDTRTGVVKGKHAYMSPEQVRRQPLDGRSDLFSLGVILWELLAGRRLFRSENPLETLALVEAAEVPSPRTMAPSAPPELCDWIMRCLARDPRDRPGSAEALRDGLAEVLGGRAPEAPAAAVYEELFGAVGATEDEVTIEEYRQALRAAELGPDESLRRREASDITFVPDTTDLAAYVEGLRGRLLATSAGERAEDGAAMASPGDDTVSAA